MSTWQRRLASFRYAWRGIVVLFLSQPNARIHLAATLLVIAGGWYFQLSQGEWIAIVLAISGVLAAEAGNTAIEFIVDLVSPMHHDLAGKAKDVAAAAVLLMAIGAAIVGILIFSPKIIHLVGVN